ncbi:hypothetical protein HOD88_01370 [archaeon]|jgi:ribosomal protein S24E|nr:hypothetical protein [archaeon]
MENYKLISKVKNDLFNRTEITATVEAKITPNHNEVEALISKEFKTNPENIKLKGINGKFGSNVFTIVANIYSSEKDKNALEIKKKWETERAKKLAEEIKAKAEEEKKAKEEAVAAKEAAKAEAEKPEEEPKGEPTGETNPEEEPKGKETEEIKPEEEPKK